MKRLLRSEKGRLLIAVLLIALVVGVNVLGGAIGLPRIDLTADRVMTPSREALEIVRTIDTPATIIFIADDDSDDIWVGELSRRYADANDNVSYKTISTDSAALSMLSAKTGVTLEVGNVVVESEKRCAVLTGDDLYSYDFDKSTYYMTGVKNYTRADFTAQNALVNALLYVSRDDMPTLYMLTGHGEAQQNAKLFLICRRNNIALKTLNLSEAGAVPEDAAALMIFGPTAGYTQAEATQIDDYLAHGGRLLLMSDYTSELGALEDVTAKYGLRQKGGLVLDGDDKHVYSTDYRYYLLPDVAATSYTEEGTFILMPVASALERGEARRDTLSVETLITSSDKAYLKADTERVSTLDYEEGDEEGCFALAMAATEGETKLIWLDSTQLLSDDADTVSSNGNSQFILSLLDGLMTRPDGVEIAATNMLVMPIDASPVPALCALLVLPLALLAAAIIAARRANRA
ncbi:MAG: Gldg family protein [Clostridiales bacterium]|nr:Gldg family protein [Clostridiales bacterium]MDY2871907.1 Gldg family protein [Eubacteriales bacterium]